MKGLEILADVRHYERTGVYAVTIDAETRPVVAQLGGI